MLPQVSLLGCGWGRDGGTPASALGVLTLPLFWKCQSQVETLAAAPPPLHVCLIRKPFRPSQLKVLALRLITAKPRTKEVKAGSPWLPSTWQLPLRLCVSKFQPLNRAVFSIVVKQSPAVSLPGRSAPFSSFYGGLRAALLFGCHSAFEAPWLHLVSGSASCQEVDLPPICCYSPAR